MELSFENPQKTLEYLTSDNVNYEELTENAKTLLSQISEPHTNETGRKYQAVTQCILECYKRIYGFSDNIWVSESKLLNPPVPHKTPITFTRINGKGEVCEYKIVNAEQIEECENTEYADEYKIIPPLPQEEKEHLKAHGNQKDKTGIEKENDNSEYNKILNLLLNGDNVFLTGHAGTGKSYILNKLKEKFKSKLTITSTTGIAAVNVKGQTLHSWAGVGLCKNPIHKTIEKIKTRPSILKQIRNCKILAIDEISMLNIETFEYVDEVLKQIRESVEPFGGIQVLFIGDFYQLPPVEKNEPEEYALFDNNTFTPTRRFCFESPLWEYFKLKNVVLKRDYRQTKQDFITALSHIRTNCITEEDTKLLQTRETNLDTFETNILHIFSTNLEADRYNMAKFNMIDEPVNIFKAEDGVYRGKSVVYNNFTDNEQYILDIFGKNCRAEKEIALKLGARVMLLVNTDFNKGLINGSCGTIQRFNNGMTITVKFDNGITADIPKHKFEYYYHDKLTAERTQFPLRLAYGITIHKSQGMTLDKLVVDCSRIFEKGQIYVAMSRVKTLDGLYLKSFSPEKVMVDERVAEFYSSLEEAEEVKPSAQLEFELDEEDIPSVSRDEAIEIIKECVSEFSGVYGKSGITKLLYGSKTITNNEFHSKAAASKFFGILKCMKQKAITSLIDEMIAGNYFKVQHTMYGRPVLCSKS